MSTINKLSSYTDPLAAGDLLPAYIQNEGDARKITMALVLAYIIANITEFTPQFDTQYSAPSATGFSVTIAPVADGDSVHLILTPVAGYAAGTIVMPLSTDCVDKQVVLVNSTQAITTLTLTGNGATITGGPTTMAANAFFRLKYDAVMNTWYRVG